MVSSTIEMELDELIATLRRIKKEYATEPDYREWRKNFPKSWPI